LTHTPLFALTVGVVVALVACVCHRRGTRRRTGLPIRLGIVVALLVGSHGILDALAQDGRGMLFLWPWTSGRFHFTWRPLPDIPTGLAIFSRLGARQLAMETVLFLPVIAYLLPWRTWWRRASRLRTVAAPAGGPNRWLRPRPRPRPARPAPSVPGL
jgi:membrane-bound metal-dependent hydrolase YbcI (DUF457 family)